MAECWRRRLASLPTRESTCLSRGWSKGSRGARSTGSLWARAVFLERQAQARETTFEEFMAEAPIDRCERRLAGEVLASLGPPAIESR
jgi:hypothetical protein